MKNTLIFLLFLLTLFACSDNSSSNGKQKESTTELSPPPHAAVTHCISYTNTPETQIKWSFNKDWNQWEGDNEKMFCVYDTSGTFVFSEKDVEHSEIPQMLTDSITVHFPEHSIKDAKHIQVSDQGVLYTLNLEKEDELNEVTYTETGAIIFACAPSNAGAEPYCTQCPPGGSTACGPGLPCDIEVFKQHYPNPGKVDWVCCYQVVRNLACCSRVPPYYTGGPYVCDPQTAEDLPETHGPYGL